MNERGDGFSQLHDLRFVVPAIVALTFAMVMAIAMLVPGIIKNLMYALGSALLGIIAGVAVLFFPVHPGWAVLVAVCTVIVGPATLVLASGQSIWDVIEQLAKARRAMREGPADDGAGDGGADGEG